MAPSPPEAQAVAEGSSPTSPVGYTRQDMNFGRLYKAATQTSKRVLKAVLMVVLSRARVAPVGEWPASVAQYCQQVLGWSNTKYRQSFNPEERAVLQQELEVADMDVSLLSKLIYKLLEDVNVPEALRRALRDIKNMRNRVCHEHLILDEDELEKNLDDLKGIYDTLLEQLDEVFVVPMNELWKTFCAELDDIKSAAVVMEASEYFEKVEQFRIEVVGRFIGEAQRELMGRYAKLQVLNPFTWLSSDRFPQLAVGKVFSPLFITEHSRNVHAATLLTAQTVSPDTGEESGHLPDVLVLSGIAGCGKTSLCRFLLHEWCTHGGAVHTLRAVDVLLHIEARNVTAATLVSFLQKTLLRDTCSRFEEKDVLAALRQVSVLYVIDGMDEATADAKMLVRDVFSQASGSRIIVTTRSEYTSDVRLLAEQHHLSHMKLAVHGFNDEGMAAFTSRVFAAFVPDEALRRQQEDEFLKFLRTSCSGLGGHLKLPLTLALLVCLWLDDKTRIASITSATRLYNEIFRLCTTKMATRLQSSPAPPPADLQGFVDSWMLELGRGAYNMLEEGRLVINEETQQQLAGLCEAKGVASLQVFSAFLHCEVHAGLLGVHQRFSFVHKSQMEYLAALYLSHEVLMETRASAAPVKSTLEKFKIFRKSVKRETRRNIHDIILFSGWGAKWANTWLFVVGHLCLQDASREVLGGVLDAILSVPAVTHNESTMWRLVEESGRHALVRSRVGSAITQDYEWRVNETDLCDAAHPVSMLMRFTTFTPRAVVLRVVGGLGGTLLRRRDGRLHTVAYDNLKPILFCMSTRPACHVFLKLDEHYYTWGAADTADHLLRMMLPGGNLVSFTGHLGPEGAAVLASVSQMGELKVRVSQADTVQALAEGVLGQAQRVNALTLRLDLAWESLPGTLPRLHPEFFDIVLRGVHDASAAAAAEILAQLSPTFYNVDLVTSRLTPEGAKTFLEALLALEVSVKGSLAVRSRHRPTEECKRQLEALLGGDAALRWWG